MTETKFFPQPTTVYRTIYGYEIPDEAHKGLIKVGETMREVNKRVKEQTKTAGIKTKIVFEEIAVKQNGVGFRDSDVHKVLKKYGIANTEGEWFKCTVEDLQRAVHQIKTGEKNDSKRTGSFGMRPEQAAAVKKTAAYFKRSKRENPDETTHFLWNAKMRFGKTFASYQLAKAMGWRKLLVLTFKPAVQDAWQQDLMTHQDFDLLVSLGVFNAALMNDAIRKFKSYEDASLEYIGINKHKDEAVGLFDTVEQRKVYFVNEPA